MGGHHHECGCRGQLWDYQDALSAVHLAKYQVGVVVIVVSINVRGGVFVVGSLRVGVAAVV